MRRAGALRGVVGVFVERDDRPADFAVIDTHDACGTFGNDLQCFGSRHPAGHAIGERIGGSVQTIRPCSKLCAYASAALETTPTISQSCPSRSRTRIRPQMPEPMPMGT